MVWIVNGYNTHQRDLCRNEIVVDLWVPVGDGVIHLKHYDSRLGSVSGLVAEPVTWMIAAQAHDHPRHRLTWISVGGPSVTDRP